jgi:hypothetical protein
MRKATLYKKSFSKRYRSGLSDSEIRKKEDEKRNYDERNKTEEI